MTARKLFSRITAHCEQIYRTLQGLSDSRSAFEQHLACLCDQAMQAYFWEDQEALCRLLREVQALASRLEQAASRDQPAALVA